MHVSLCSDDFLCVERIEVLDSILSKLKVKMAKKYKKFIRVAYLRNAARPQNAVQSLQLSNVSLSVSPKNERADYVFSTPGEDRLVFDCCANITADNKLHE